jgi:spermidine synthase
LKPRWLFLFFLVSGFCSLVYEVVWLRLAMASFGVTTPIVAMVLSIFMGGLAIGSWGAGRLTPRLAGRPAAAPLRLYALAELVIGLSGVLVPPGLHLGRAMLSWAGAGIAWGSASHHIASGVWIGMVLLPFAAAMGATFPLAMASLRPSDAPGASRSFSYLYLANVLGASAGTVVSALFMIELLGFRGTLWVTASMNALLAAAAFGFSRSLTDASKPASAPRGADRSVEATDASAVMLGLLFLTGLTSMALEVVWVRQLTPFLGTVVYAFAMILSVYLLATSLGSAMYRRWGAAGAGSVWLASGCFALLSLAAADPRLGAPGFGAASFVRVVLGIAPFSAAVGFLTPLLVDRWSQGAPQRAGSAYAVNVIGCILGPLLGSFVLLPWVGERWAVLVLSAPLFAVGVTGIRLHRWRIPLVAGSAALAVALLLGTRDFESVYAERAVKRDATATVIAAGTGMKKQLLVNGYGMTTLSTITKSIAHIPMAFLPVRPQNVLVICFGMGTSFRSAVSWGVPTTSVELIPSVPELFGFFHADAAEVLAQPGARIVIDDGRRFLERTTETYDVIVIDPPPPVEAAGSSLLYSREFYAAVRPRLRPGGIVQQWFPGGNLRLAASVARSLKESFRYVRVFGSIERWGLHFLASDTPIPVATADTLAARLPPAAMRDLLEWEPRGSVRGFFAAILRQEVAVDSVIASQPNAPALTDDRPVNEYDWVRQTFGP